MATSRRNKNNREQDNQHPEEEITDVLLMDENDIPQKEKVDDVIYELVVEDKEAAADAAMTSDADKNNSSAEITSLKQSHNTMKQQMEKMVATSDKLAKELIRQRRSKQASITSYVALSMAGLALIIGLAAALFIANLHSDIKNHTDSIATLENHKHLASTNAPVDAEGINARIDELSTKFDML